MRWSTTVGLRCSLCPLQLSDIVGATYSSVGQCGCASLGGWTDDQWCGSDVLVVPELGVAPLVDSGTDLEDELPTPDGSPSMDAVKPG